MHELKYVERARCPLGAHCSGARADSEISLFRFQNSLMEYTTVQLVLPPELCPADVSISAYVTIGRAGSFLRNEIGMQLLAKFGVWDHKGTGATHAILGPILYVRPPSPSTTVK